MTASADVDVAEAAGLVDPATTAHGPVPTSASATSFALGAGKKGSSVSAS